MFGKTTVVAVLGGALLVAGALPAVADARKDCEKRIRKAEQNLQREIERHGEHGKDVEKRRRELERQRENCRMYERDRDHHDHDKP
jgi:hypothetical protein